MRKLTTSSKILLSQYFHVYVPRVRCICIMHFLNAIKNGSVSRKCNQFIFFKRIISYQCWCLSNGWLELSVAFVISWTVGFSLGLAQPEAFHPWSWSLSEQLFGGFSQDPCHQQEFLQQNKEILSYMEGYFYREMCYMLLDISKFLFSILMIVNVKNFCNH